MDTATHSFDISLEPGIRLGSVAFSYQEKEVLAALGQPSERKVYYYTSADEGMRADTNNQQLQYSINLYYPHLAVFIGYEGNRFQGTSIHIDDVRLLGQSLAALAKEEVLSLLQAYHEEQQIDYAVHTTTNPLLQEVCYEYDNVGLTIWYEGHSISNICVQQAVE